MTEQVAIAQALSHPLRLRLLQLLAEDTLIVSELMERAEADQVTVSKHLRVLRDAGLVSCEADGRCRHYSLEHADELRQILAALAQLEHTISNGAPRT